ncbi:uncharacterized protein BT62DRAFT_921595 [Guyanagaster necrorhizus]|uniref:Uncharacterized protein n=1 Tax=Guyanagaster necrorhizus TaxID=856835 RepID=A0A9P8AQC4_9AGAR|nr:uncharacterized protein BT62DRAFT_921595 [Guyanagaster necrorhizus MCA 3950]KAG7443959.1 hypothetical protein BT62DRAFT_921595 [Guyanagaster necrorhizus MCA 3950]
MLTLSNDEPHHPDGFTFLTHYQCEPGIIIYKPDFGQLDILIHLISIDGNTTGDEHYKALQQLSTGHATYMPWFYNIAKILDYLMQVFKTAVCFDEDSDPSSRKLTGLSNEYVGRAGEYAREYALEMLVNEPYCPFKADMWYLGQMLNADMDREVKGFIEKHLKALHEDFLFDDMFRKYFAQNTIQSEQIMQAFDEYIDKVNEIIPEGNFVNGNLPPHDDCSNAVVESGTKADNVATYGFCRQNATQLSGGSIV